MKIFTKLLMIILFSFILSSIIGSDVTQKLKVGEVNSYSIRFKGNDAGFCKFIVEKKQNDLYIIKGETYFEVDLARGIIYHFRERLLLSSKDLIPHEYFLEVLRSPQPVQSIEAKIKPNLATIIYTLKSGENIIKDEKKIEIPNENLVIVDSNVVEHSIFLIKKYDFRKKDPQEIISLNAQAGQTGKLFLINKGKENVKINDKEYSTYHISVQIENISAFEGWVDIKSQDVLKVTDSKGILEITLSK